MQIPSKNVRNWVESSLWLGLSYDFAVRLGQDDMPDVGWPPHIGRKGTDRNRTGRLRTGLE